MTSIFDLNKHEFDLDEQINMDELYEKKHASDLNKLSIYKKLLSRVHVRIRTVSNQKKDNTFCWFVVPEIIIGVPRYDQGSCIAFLMDKLQENGFMVRYTHPNLLFISWNHWVPSYVRSEIKKKTGVNVDGYGNILEQKQDKQESENNGLNPFQFANTKNEKTAKEKEKENYKSIRTYKPSGNLIYNNDVLNPFKNNDT